MMGKYRNIYIKVKQIGLSYINKILLQIITRFPVNGICYINASRYPLFFEAGSRIPNDVKPIPSSLRKNAKFSSGKTLSFTTDTNYLEFYVLYSRIALLTNMNIKGASATDIIIASNNDIVVKTIYAASSLKMIVHEKFNLTGTINTIKLFLPGYATVSRIFIGIERNSNIWVDEDHHKPIVFYGSSITQGCCASSPSKSYARLVAEHFHYPMLNFGFSESAKGEPSVISHIASHSASLFIIEYDHNADICMFRSNHYKVYKTIREKNPMTPIILLSRFSGGLSITIEEENKRISIIKKTLAKAKSEGDYKIYFVSGKNVILEKDRYFVDDRHPNDRGMKIIADRIIDCIDKNNILGEVK